MIRKCIIKVVRAHKAQASRSEGIVFISVNNASAAGVDIHDHISVNSMPGVIPCVKAGMMDSYILVQKDRLRL